MKVEFFIARRIIFRSKVSTTEGGNGTRSIIKIAVIGIALGVAIMIAALAIVTGFQQEIRSKVVGFGSHIQVTAFNPLVTDYTRPIDRNQAFVKDLLSDDAVKSVQVFATKEGIVKTDEEIHGVIVKGVDTDFDWDFFSKNLVQGNALKLSSEAKSDSILISKTIADKLKLQLKDKVIIYFIQDEKSKPRRFYISGIYNTSLEQFDDRYIIADIKHIQKLNDWSPNVVSGFEILLKNYEDLDRLDDFIYKYIDYDLTTVKITDLNRDIFGWLELQDINVIIIIALIILVSGINMTSALMIMILERTGFIGLLKAMGATNWKVRKIFLINAAYLIALGLFWGNLVGVGLCFLQDKFKLVSLPQEQYYIEHVPINLELSHVLLLNVGTLVLCTLMLVIPSYFVSKIAPIKALRFN